MNEEQKPEMEILFPEVEVEGLRVRPWALGQLVDLTSTFEILAVEINKRKITLENLEKGEVIKELVFAFLPQVIRILSVSIREDEVKIREWPIDKSIAVMAVVISQNLDNIKNSFGLGKSILKTLKKAG